MTLWELWSGAAVPYWEVQSDEEVAKRVEAGTEAGIRGISHRIYRKGQKNAWN